MSYAPWYVQCKEEWPVVVVNTPGWLPTGYGQEYSSPRFHGGTLYNDADTGIIFVENQVSLGSSETVLWKESFEQWLWEKVCV